MDWKNIKTIFIFTFLILNAYLGTELNEKVNPDFDRLPEETVKSLEKIKFEGGPIPKVKKDLSLVSGQAAKFTEETKTEFLDTNSNQKINIISDTIINATLIDPIEVTTDSDVKVQLGNFIEDYIPFASQYEYWKYIEDRNLYLFRQQYETVPFYFSELTSNNNVTGLIEISTNEQGEITSYRLTSMEIEKENMEEKLITAEEALMVKDIPEGATVKDMKLVYYTWISPIEGWKFFVPSWHIVTENQNLMVDATDASVISLEQNEDEGSEVK